MTTSSETSPAGPAARIATRARRAAKASPDAESKPNAVLALIDRLGGMVALALRSATALVTPPFTWWREWVNQSIFIFKVALLPTGISIAAWGFSGPGLQAGNFLTILGSVDRSGGFMVVSVVREFGTFVTATTVAGVVGTTIAAEFGARTIRGEMDALRVLGVDPIRTMVAPRILALTVSMMAIDCLATVFGVLGGYPASVLVLGGTSGGFISSFFANSTFVDLAASVIKCGIFGALIGIICCYRGLQTKGGPEGVGRAVNDAVVGCIVAIFLVNLLYTQFFLAVFPEAGVFR